MQQIQDYLQIDLAWISHFTNVEVKQNTGEPKTVG